MVSVRKKPVVVALVVVVLAAGAVLAWRVLGGGGGAEARPVVTVTSAGQTVTVAPLRYCDLAELREAFASLSEWEATGEKAVQEDPDAMFERVCEATDEPALITVEDGSPVTVAVPEEISGAPWSLLTMYQGGDADDTDGGIEVYRPGQTSEVTLDPVDGQGRRLAVVEVRLPAGIIDPQTGSEDFISHATWAVNAR